jgi:hypothetical protein
MSRSLRVEFLSVDEVNGVSPGTVVHDIALPDDVDGVPRILENPHVDFPGTWSLVGDGQDGAHRYERVDRIADTSGTAAG